MVASNLPDLGTGMGPAPPCLVWLDSAEPAAARREGRRGCRPGLSTCKWVVSYCAVSSTDESVY